MSVAHIFDNLVDLGEAELEAKVLYLGVGGLEGHVEHPGHGPAGVTARVLHLSRILCHDVTNTVMNGQYPGAGHVAAGGRGQTVQAWGCHQELQHLEEGEGEQQQQGAPQPSHVIHDLLTILFPLLVSQQEL